MYGDIPVASVVAIVCFGGGAFLARAGLRAIRTRRHRYRLGGEVTGTEAVVAGVGTLFVALFFIAFGATVVAHLLRG